MKLLRPTSLADAVAALALPGAQAIAGGTALQLAWEAGAAKPAILIDMSGLPELQGVRQGCDEIHIGALTPLEVLQLDQRVGEALPLLARAVRDVAGPSVRRMGTLGGQVGWGVGCLLPALLVLEAHVVLAGPGGALEKAALADFLS